MDRLYSLDEITWMTTTASWAINAVNQLSRQDHMHVMYEEPSQTAPLQQGENSSNSCYPLLTLDDLLEIERSVSLPTFVEGSSSAPLAPAAEDAYYYAFAGEHETSSSPAGLQIPEDDTQALHMAIQQLSDMTQPRTSHVGPVRSTRDGLARFTPLSSKKPTRVWAERMRPRDTKQEYVWGGKKLPLMRADKLWDYLTTTGLVVGPSPVVCGWPTCGDTYTFGNFRTHIESVHQKFKMYCANEGCFYSSRQDNFPERHKTCPKATEIRGVQGMDP